MLADIAKSPLGYLAEFHCHTALSHDAFTSEAELLRVCVAKRIGLLTVTEHDRLPTIDATRFAAAGIRVIPGCEFTCSKGSHIIGLFVGESLPKGRPAREVFAHILGGGGVVLIPHPFKACSGFCALHEDHETYLADASLMEAYNGGLQDEGRHLDRVRELARKHDLRLVAASDSHKADQVGYYVTAYQELLGGDLRATLLRSQGRLFVDGARRRQPRSLNAIQRHNGYQGVVARLPPSLKRAVKMCLYRVRQRGYLPGTPSYVELSR